jgi:hypothetical protein
MTTNGLLGLLGTPEEIRKRAAWEKASAVLGYDPATVRRDAYGWHIIWADYGNRDSAYGWEIDHTMPTALGGGDGLSNLRALHWRNNAGLGGRLGATILGTAARK